VRSQPSDIAAPPVIRKLQAQSASLAAAAAAADAASALGRDVRDADVSAAAGDRRPRSVVLSTRCAQLFSARRICNATSQLKEELRMIQLYSAALRRMLKRAVFHPSTGNRCFMQYMVVAQVKWYTSTDRLLGPQPFEARYGVVEAEGKCADMKINPFFPDLTAQSPPSS
jgi:hypothetical protein